jgi:hypothetical protein
MLAVFASRLTTGGGDEFGGWRLSRHWRSAWIGEIPALIVAPQQESPGATAVAPVDLVALTNFGLASNLQVPEAITRLVNFTPKR